MKTRLAAVLGDAPALAIYRRLAEHTLGVVREAAAASGGRTVVYHTPAGCAAAMAAWLGDDLEYRAQRGEDLGARMAHAVAAELARGASAAVVVGTDCPGLRAALLLRAVAELDTNEVAVGPAADGGYYLLALRTLHEALFRDIPWSAPDTLARTVAAAARAGLTVGCIAEQADIDTAEDWMRWCAETDSLLPGSLAPLASLPRRA